MGESLQLVRGRGSHCHFVAFSVITVLLQVFVFYRKLVPILKVLKLLLLAYVFAVFMVQVPWAQVLCALVVSKLQWTSGYSMMIVALLASTIFFWQSSQEVEALRLKGVGHASEAERRQDLRRVKRDTSILQQRARIAPETCEKNLVPVCCLCCKNSFIPAIPSISAVERVFIQKRTREDECALTWSEGST